MDIFTIGHSTRPLDGLMRVLKHYGIELLIDVRHFLLSRHNPQFNKELLEQELPRHGMAYQWIECLGGFRKGGYISYMKTRHFNDEVGALAELSKRQKTAIMCAEIVWFRCHRRHIADALASRGFRITHIIEAGKTYPHNRAEGEHDHVRLSRSAASNLQADARRKLTVQRSGTAQRKGRRIQQKQAGAAPSSMRSQAPGTTPSIP